VLDKCSNPACLASFRYLNDGRLFRIESDPSSASTCLKKSEYFWLCRKCALAVTLRLAEDATVQMVRRHDHLPAAKNGVDFITVDRKDGLVLSCLNFLGESVASSWMGGVRGKLLYAS